MSKYSVGSGLLSPMLSGNSFLSKKNQILHVFSVEFIVEDKKKNRLLVKRRAIANTPEEVIALVREATLKSPDRIIEFVGEPILLGKDRTWLTLGKKANNLGPRITDEVVYVETRERSPTA